MTPQDSSFSPTYWQTDAISQLGKAEFTGSFWSIQNVLTNVKQFVSKTESKLNYVLTKNPQKMPPWPGHCRNNLLPYQRSLAEAFTDQSLDYSNNEQQQWPKPLNKTKLILIYILKFITKTQPKMSLQKSVRKGLLLLPKCHYDFRLNYGRFLVINFRM